MKKRLIRNKLLNFKTLLIILFIAILSSVFSLFYNLPKNKTLLNPLASEKIPLGSNNSLEKLLLKEDIPFESISQSSDSSYTITLKDGGEVILSSKKDVLAEISSLQFVLKRLTIEGKRFKRLDLRFDKPTIVF